MSTLAERLRARVLHLSQTIGERHFERPEALAATESYLREQLATLGATVRELQFEVEGRSYINFEARVPSSSGQVPEPGCLVLGAHYDTVPGTPGADDNASGVAALLELVSELRTQRLRRAVRLVFFPNEEQPFFADGGMGSAAYAAQLRREGIAVHVMISLEMLGYYSDLAHTQKYPPGLSLLYPNRGNFIGFVTNLGSWRRMREVKRAFQACSPFPCESLAAPEWTQVVALSDHRSFWREGYPALMVTDTAFMRNPNYHQSTDTADTLDYGRFADVTAGLAAALKVLASTP